MPDPCTCGALEKIREKFDLPFRRPIIFNNETNSLRVGGWCAQLNKLTPSGNISKNGGGFIELKFCPFCGGRLGEGDGGASGFVPEVSNG